MPTTATKRERFNIYLPGELAEQLRAEVPARERTRFIVDLIERELRRVRLKGALEASFGAWSDDNHPELTGDADLERWLQEARRSRDWEDNPPASTATA